VGKAPSGYQAILRSRTIKYRNGARLHLRSDIHCQDGSRSRCQHCWLNFGDRGLDHLSGPWRIETLQQTSADQWPGNGPEPEGWNQAPKLPLVASSVKLRTMHRLGCSWTPNVLAVTMESKTSISAAEIQPFQQESAHST